MNSKTLTRLAILNIGAAGILGSAFGALSIIGYLSILGLFLLLFSSNKKEIFLWIIIFSTLILLFTYSSSTEIQKVLRVGSEFGTLMITISFVGLAARISRIRFILCKFIDQKENTYLNYILGHISGVFLNLSGLIILSESMKNHKDESLIVSIHRGFAYAPSWSPYSYFTPIILATFTSIKWIDLVFVSFVFIIPAFFVSSLLSIKNNNDKKEIQKKEVKFKINKSEKKALLYTVLFCLSIICLMSFTTIQSKTIIHFFLPLLALIWAYLESKSIISFYQNLKDHIYNNLIKMRFEILALTTAGLVSSAFMLVSVNEFSSFLIFFNEQGISDTFVVLLLFVGISIFMILGINPILFIGVVLMGTNFELYSVVTGVALLVGAWGLFSTLSPFAAANLVIARGLGVSSETLSFKTNKLYNFYIIIISTIIIIIFHKLNMKNIIK